MSQHKILSIVGARPQFIKLAPVADILKKKYDHVILHTGQHYNKNMSDLFFKELKIPEPKYNLGIGSSSHAGQTAKMLAGIERILLTEKPFLVIVYGDTNSTLAGSIAAAKLNIKIVHVEAGLRSFNKVMPEEINRVLTDHSSDYLFAPTKTAMSNLKNEGLSGKSFFTGDITVDAIRNNISYALENQGVMKKVGSDKYYLLTLHRPYNVDNLNTLTRILKELGKTGKQIVFPVHPRTASILKQGASKLFRNIRFISPVGYFDFLTLQSNAEKIITDSGGIQKEAYILKKPCVTLRSETEWIETVSSGWNILIDPNKVKSFAGTIESFFPKKRHEDLFGQNVAERMLKIINEIS